MTPGFAQRPMWARLMIVLGMLLAALGVVVMFVRTGDLTRNGVEQNCGLPIIMVFPSDPYRSLILSRPSLRRAITIARPARNSRLLVLAGGFAAGIAGPNREAERTLLTAAELAAASRRLGPSWRLVAPASGMASCARWLEILGPDLLRAQGLGQRPTRHRHRQFRLPWRRPPAQDRAWRGGLWSDSVVRR